MDASGTGTADSGAGAGGRSPFQGLSFYTEADARWFFGRSTERKIILAHLRTARLTLLYAESGVGKSSLLRAGVAARLRELAAQSIAASRLPRFVPVVFNAWKDDPVEDMIREISRQVGPLRPQPGGKGDGRGANGSASPLAGAITAAAHELDATLVVILDQFEEHFSYRRGDSHPDRLADELAQCINSPSVPAHFLIAVREDTYGRLGDLFSGRIGNVYSNYLHLEYLTREAARDAIEKPVELYNSEHDGEEPIAVEEGLTDAVLDEVRRGHLELGLRRSDRNGGANSSALHTDEIETPFLQLVMTRLWDWEREHGSRVLRKATLAEELGGAERIVRNHVDRALAGLGAEEVQTATDIFHDLVTPSGVKVAHTAKDLAQMSAHSEDTVESVVRKLYTERILRVVDPAPGTTNARYELFHDRLATPVLDWRVKQENARLERAKWEAELEAETQRARARRFKRRARIMLGLAISLLVLLAAVIVLLQYARDTSATASREKRVATYFGLTTRAQSQLSSRPDVSLLLYLAAYGESPQPAAERNLAATLQSLTRSGAIGVLHGHTDAVGSLAFSPSGTTLASASSDRTIRLWNVTPAAHYPLGPPLIADGPLYSVAFSPNGETLASGSFNHIILWSARRHAEQGEIRYRSGAIDSVAFAARGNLLAAGGSNGTVLLWNAVTHRRALLTVPGGASVRSVAFDPTGDVLAAGSGRSVALWNVSTGRELGQPLTGPTGPVYSVSFSPDGRTIAAGGESGTIVRWDLATHLERPPALTSRSSVFGIAFSPDGQALAAGGTGATVVWNLAGGDIRRQVLSGHQGVIYSVAFSPDGHVLASAGADRTITLWNHPVGPRFGIPLVRHPTRVEAVAVSPDGLTIASGDADGPIFLTNRRTGTLDRMLHAGAGTGPVRDLAFEPAGRVLAAAYNDGTIRLWDLATGRQLGAPLRGDVGPVYTIALDPSGTLLASGGADGTVRLWDLRSHRELGRPLTGAIGPVFAVAFSPNGRALAAGGDGRAIRLWDPHTGLPLDPPLIAQDDSVFTLAFSPGGRVLAAGGADDTIHLWAVHPHAYAPSGILTGHSNFVRSIAFSPDGRTLASGSTDTTIRLWDVATGTELGTPLTGDGGAVEDIASSKDGQFLVSGSVDQTVRLWQAVRLPQSFADLRNRVCSFVGAGLSTAEWAHYASNIPYHQACPRSTPS